MKKQNVWKKFSKINSFFLVTIFIFSSLFALTGCSTSNIFAGIVYTQKGYDYLVDSISSSILDDLYDEYGMAVGTSSGENNWGSLNFDSLLGHNTVSYNDAKKIEIANDLSNFNYFYYKEVEEVAGNYIIICSTRYLYPEELGDGENNGMIVGLQDNYFYMRNRNPDGTLKYGNLPLHPINVDVTNLTLNTDLSFNIVTANPIKVSTNSAYRYFVENQPSDSKYTPFTAYVFVGQTVGGRSLSEPVSFLTDFYAGSHVNALQKDFISFENSSATPTTSWLPLPTISEVWKCRLTDDELASKTKIEKRKELFVQKYDEYLAMFIAKNILVGSGNLSSYPEVGQTVSANYDATMAVVESYINGSTSVFHQDVVDATKEFFVYVTDTIGVSLFYDANDLNYVKYSIFSKIIGSDMLTLNSSSSTAVEKTISTSPFFKNYVQTVDEIVSTYVGENKDTNNLSMFPTVKGYYLERDGFEDKIVCSLSSLFFSNANVDKSIFQSVDKSLPDFTVFFEADEANMNKLKNYTFYLYYHKSGAYNINTYVSVDADENIKEFDYLIKINVDRDNEDDEFMNNLLNGIIYVDVNAIFGVKKDIVVELGNYSAYEDDPLNNGFLNTVPFSKDNSVIIFDSDPNYYPLTRDSFDFVELICVPPSPSSTATITITDIMI